MFGQRRKRFENQGWKWSCHTECGDGHSEDIFENKDFPGLLLHRDCCGGWNLLPGVVKEEVKVIRGPHFFKF